MPSLSPLIWSKNHQSWGPGDVESIALGLLQLKFKFHTLNTSSLHAGLARVTCSGNPRTMQQCWRRVWGWANPGSSRWGIWQRLQEEGKTVSGPLEGASCRGCYLGTSSKLEAVFCTCEEILDYQKIASFIPHHSSWDLKTFWACLADGLLHVEGDHSDHCMMPISVHYTS